MEALVTWLWQGCLLTAVVACLLRGTAVNAATRYLVWWATLAAVLTLPLLSLGPQITGTGSLASEASAALVTQPPTPTPETPVSRSPIELPALPLWLTMVGVGLWGALAASRLCGLARSLVRLAQMRRSCRALPMSTEQRLPLWLSLRNDGRRARLCMSTEIPVASMIGFAQPIIAVPPSLLAELSAEELDHVVLHELAHVRRRDDWANLVQICIEAILGMHPAVWWIGRSLRLEREVACDDWAVRDSSASRLYASSLAKVAALASRRPYPRLVPGLTRSSSELSKRVMRLLDPGRNRAVPPSWLTTTAALGGLVLVVGALAQLDPLITIRAVAAGRTPVWSAAPPLTAGLPASFGQRVAPEPAVVPAAPQDELSPAEAETRPIQGVALPLIDAHRSVWPQTVSTGPISEPPPLQSVALRTEPMTLATTGPPVGLENTVLSAVGPVAPVQRAWGRVVGAGRTVGTGATRAGRATATAASNLGIAVKNVFVR